MRHSDWKLWDLKYKGVPLNPDETIERYITGASVHMVIEPKPYVAAKASIYISNPTSDERILLALTFSPEWKLARAFPGFQPERPEQEHSHTLRWPVETDSSNDGHLTSVLGILHVFGNLFWEAQKMPFHPAYQLAANEEDEAVSDTLDVSLTPDNAMVIPTYRFFAVTDQILRRFTVAGLARTAFHLNWQKEVIDMHRKEQEFVALRVLNMSDYSKSIKLEVEGSSRSSAEIPHSDLRLFFVFGGIPKGATEWEDLIDRAKGMGLAGSGLVDEGVDWLPTLGMNLDEWNIKLRLHILEIGGMGVPVYPAMQQPTQSEGGNAREAELDHDGLLAALSVGELMRTMVDPDSEAIEFQAA
jgi:hypothetical protein